MTTNADIIRRAHRLMGTVSAGQSPTGPDAEDSMEQLQELILELPGLLKNGRWREHATSAAYTAKEGQRLTLTAPGVVTLPATVAPYGCSTRPPMDLARVQILGADAENAGLWVYVATKAAWSKVDGLLIGEAFPFGDEDIAGVAAQLAVNLADEYGEAAQVGERTLARAQASARSFRARFKKAGPKDWTRPQDYDRERCTDYC